MVRIELQEKSFKDVCEQKCYCEAKLSPEEAFEVGLCVHFSRGSMSTVRFYTANLCSKCGGTIKVTAGDIEPSRKTQEGRR